jgi:general secretion pathway protein A
VQPVPSTDQDAPLYEAFYGLREQPFALSTDPRFLFMGASHRRAYDELLTGLRRREGLLLLTGETGTGKTTLCRAVLDGLGPRTFSALILNPYMSATEVLRVILRDFGLVSREEIRRGAFARADTPTLLDTLESFLVSLVPLNSYAVVVIDEAQSLAPEVLDQVRMLGAYEQDGQRLVQIVLVGQPGLLATVQTEQLRALNERITRRAALAPLPPSEIEGYVRHRLAVAGRGDAVIFDADALSLLTKLSRGLPRRVNLLCDRALEEGRGERATVIGAELIKRAARAVAGTQPEASIQEPLVAPSVPETPATIFTPAPKRRSLVPILAAIAVLLVLAGGVGGYYAWTIVKADPGIPASPPAPVVHDAPMKPVPPLNDEEMKNLLAWIERGSQER